MNTSTAPLSLRERWALYLDLIRWNRPQGWLLLLWPTLMALWLAAGGFPGWHLLIVFTLGTILMRSAGCAVNDVADKDFDRHVERTAQRPITSGKLSVKESLAVGAVLALVSFALVLTTNPFTVGLSFGALGVTILYPFTKRFFSMPQAVLGVAFSFGIPMAFTAIQNQVPSVVWWLMVGNLGWVLAYDTEYAMVDRNDDLKIGMRTSAITLGRFDVVGVMGFYALCLLCWFMAGQEAGRGLWFNLSLLAAGAQALWHGWLIKGRERMACFKAFRLNHWLGLTVWVGLVVDTALAR
ncbi:4-hydroxybenzoate octaprenyltransferase [Aquabacterium sp.]|uniref:4-hydroxybenzoate octaprenyltransferase n=1 Tax=Aquabacterium sp. TaxID=1872578 RepID=UPI002E324613|nr:4-hydroxybenzoate octaprenyltransferase [Aquabacterium sp.]HEX5312042.1 4-hydroxybenzoate octaprenyltransferase [Aquabacterium sp.]